MPIKVPVKNMVDVDFNVSFQGVGRKVHLHMALTPDEINDGMDVDGSFDWEEFEIQLEDWVRENAMDRLEFDSITLSERK